MTSAREDSKILHELDFILRDDLNLYCNFKKNVAAAYTMKLTTDAEREFLRRNTENYLLFTPVPEFAITFLNYCHLDVTTDTPYFFIRKDGRLASIFCVNSTGIITQRKHIASLNKMADVYYSFECELRKYKPKQRNLDSTAASPALLTATGAIAV